MLDQPVTEADWQAEDDARTLARAEVIKNDQSRLTKAQQAANKIAEREMKEASAMKKVAGRKVTNTNGSQGSKKPSGPYNVFQKI
jgi:hypothetical protein